MELSASCIMPSKISFFSKLDPSSPSSFFLMGDSNSLRFHLFLSPSLRLTTPSSAHHKRLCISPPRTHHAHSIPNASAMLISSSSDVVRQSQELPPRPSAQSQQTVSNEGSRPPPRILVAGGGIGGLVFALAAKNRGMDVTVFERDMSAIRGEGQYRGPIQIQSNALAALESVDKDVADEIMANGCITGDRINGLVDGISGNW